MSDDIRNRDQPDPDDVGDIEQLLRELDLADLEQTPPPPLPQDAPNRLIAVTLQN